LRSSGPRGVEPATWLVALGTNDMYAIRYCGCPDMGEAARARVRLMLGAIGPGRNVYWVGVQNFSYPASAAIFNDVLEELVNAGELAGSLDWETISAGRRITWFVDNVHLNPAGYNVWFPAVAALAVKGTWSATPAG
jgi:lysophospholipase L1-like esterase